MKYQIAALILVSFCATTGGDKDSLKPTLEAFHNGMRWKEFRLLTERVTVEKRDAFEKGVRDRDDDKNLQVTDYQLEECKIAPGGMSAVCYSKVSWYRLPSSSEKTVTVATTMQWKGGQWLVDRQSDGPFAEELSVGSDVTPAPDSGAAN